MATAAISDISVEEYLASAYHPDVDYIDGVLEERNMGEADHADLQTELVTLLRMKREAWQIFAVVEIRFQVAPRRFRIPDVCVMSLSWKRTPIVREAPLLCIEVLSPEDRLQRVLSRCRDFLAMGVPNVWMVDPVKRTAHHVTPDSVVLEVSGNLSIAGTPITIDLPALFAVLDL